MAIILEITKNNINTKKIKIEQINYKMYRTKQKTIIQTVKNNYKNNYYNKNNQISCC